MVKKSSLEGASWERISGPVTGKPSVKRDSRPGLVFGVGGIGVDVEDARDDIVWDVCGDVVEMVLRRSSWVRPCCASVVILDVK